MPQPDGSQKAVEIHIFPEALRGMGEGHRPWDLVPNSTMTNANIESAVASSDGKELVLKYKDGEKKFTVPANIEVVMRPLDESTHWSRGVAQYAIEMRQGWFATKGIGVGDVVEGLR